MRFLLMVFLLSCSVHAQNILSEDNFPDAQLRSFLSDTFGALTAAEAAVVESLDCSNRGIADLTGLSYFTGLTRLYVQHNEVSDLSELEALADLEVIYAWSNQLTNIDVIASLDHLRVVLICCNQISSLPFLGHLTQLESLVIYDNQLTSLPGLPKPLKALDIGGNPFAAFPDLTRLNLEELGIQDLGLTELPDLSNHTNLRSLDCQNNLLQELPDLSDFPELVSLGVWSNQLTTLPDLSALTHLRYLYACCNGLTSVPDLSALTELRHLYVYDNELTQLPSLAGLQNLERVYLRHNRLSDLESIVENTYLGTQPNHELDVRDNALTSANCFQIRVLSDRFAASGASFEYQTESNPIDCAQVPWLVHVTRSGGGFQTTIHVKNFSQTAGQVAFTPYDASGEMLTSAVLDVAPLEHAVVPAATLFDNAEVSHASFLGSPGCDVSIAYRLADGVGASANVNGVFVPQREFWVYLGERDVVFDGLALVNVGGEDAVVTGELYDAAGDLAFATTLEEQLAPRAKTLCVLSDVFPDVADGILRITSTTDAVATFLRGTAPGVTPGLLFQTVPLAR